MGLTKKTKIYQASTSELYGLVQDVPHSETIPFYPRSPNNVAKLYAYWITVNYREAYDMFACNGILLNHESPQRGETFVTSKITRATAKIVFGLEECMSLGNLNSERDWGHAKDYVEGMWRILLQDKREDFVLATGLTTTIRKFVLMAFGEVVKVDPRYYRPTEVDLLFGDSSKVKLELSWEPKCGLIILVNMLLYSDLKDCK